MEAATAVRPDEGLRRLLAASDQENEILRARVRQLEDALIGTFEVPVEWSLTGSERQVFGVLVTRSLATREAIMAALYRDNAVDEAEIKIIDVFVCKIRKKLDPFGVKIATIWGQGYSLAPEWRAKFQPSR